MKQPAHRPALLPVQDMGRVDTNPHARRFATTLGIKSLWPVRLGNRIVIAAVLVAGFSLSAAGHSWAEVTTEGVHGLPFTRFYSYDEIGDVGPGARLGFDSFGRLAAIHVGGYVVLNDTTWIDIERKETAGPAMQRVVFGPDGQAYFGAFGSWGLVEVTPEGLLHPRSLRPASCPKWVLDSNFTEIVLTGSGVYFAGFNGVVYWDRKSNTHVFFEIPQFVRIFAIGDTVFVTSNKLGLQALDVQGKTLQPVSVSGFEGALIERVTAFGPGRVLLSTMDGQLLTFDGKNGTAWPAQPNDRPAGRITALGTLVDGSFAVAINGKGLYFFSKHGEILFSLTTTEYHRITDLATREPGVLWVSTESGIVKVLYESPLTVFGQRLGLPISWPQVARWNDRIEVASGGRLYESIPGPSSETTRFEPVGNQPRSEIWGVAAIGSRMLVGNRDGVFARDEGGGFTPVLSGLDVARLVMVSPELCFVLGTKQITALRWSDGHWSECAQRVDGLGYPAIVHAAKKSAWIELGANRAARVALKEGKVEVRVFDAFPWHDARWINLGFVDDTVILTGLPDGQIYFDEKTESVVPAPRIQRMLDKAPFRIARMKQDESGTIWASHDHGLLVIRPAGNDFQVDSTTFGKINDFFPVIQLLSGVDVWLATAQSLYHVDRRFGQGSPAAYKPSLVSVMDGNTGKHVATETQPDGTTLLKYAQNNLVFRFFAGSYGSRQSPAYEFRLNRGANIWNPFGNGSVLNLTDLNEGTYRLDVRLNSGQATAGAALTFRFEIEPPWYRTWYAYALYALTLALTVVGLIWWSTQRSRLKNVALEKLVDERTEALRIAMHKLNEETRNAATVAERDRLAGEIHDSLQQGLSGLMLQLDATLKLPGLSPEVRSRLGVARNMVSFTRHEVQNAVWDMETPLLEGTDLGEALRKLSALIGPGTAEVAIMTSGQPTQLSPSTKHHLLRIAQEAITNAVRHAAASMITMTLEYQPDRVSLSITDDGNGFVPHDVLTSGIGHFGLRGLRGRAAKIGGKLEIRSAPGEGTTVRVIVQTATPALSHANAP
jgi:signal transduction histidine kinase